MTERERPSKHGKILGDALALLAVAGRKDAPMPVPECCLTCAFRPGAMPNEMAATGKTALDCVLGIDKDRFACHHGMKDGDPQKLCAGYVAALLAPWSFTKEVLAAVKRDLGTMGDGPDEVRAAFDRWHDEVDPDRKMDDYQLARAYAKRPRTGFFATIVHNVDDRRRGWVGSWETEPLDYNELGPAHIGRTVIYRDHGRAEAGTISSWRNGMIFARYSRGDTAAGAKATDILLGVRPLDGPALETKLVA